VDDVWTRIAENMAARVTGTMKFRLLLQPLMASILAIRSGLADARALKPPFIISLLSDPANRADTLREAWGSVGKVFLIALILDVVYQVVATRFVYPGEAIITALVLAILPYVILRGVVTRLTRKS